MGSAMPDGIEGRTYTPLPRSNGAETEAFHVHPCTNIRRSEYGSRKCGVRHPGSTVPSWRPSGTGESTISFHRFQFLPDESGELCDGLSLRITMAYRPIWKEFGTAADESAVLITPLYPHGDLLSLAHGLWLLAAWPFTAFLTCFSK
jgi:hypothetical protein